MSLQLVANMESTSKAGRSWYKLQEIALFSLMIQNKRIGGSWDGERANKVKYVWEPVLPL